MEKNDLLIDPLAVLPALTVEGKVVGVRVDGDELIQEWHLEEEAAAPLHSPSPEEPNDMHFEGGTLRMGKLFMVRADMEVIDLDPSDPFDFFIDYYNNQLVAGRSENQPDYGLKVFMRDFADLGAAPSAAERAQEK